jgi:anti-sigma28 factor (negative regulator of flagellin synthesis)
MIGPIENNPTRFNPAVSGQEGGEEKKASQTPPADRVEISQEARERAANLESVSGLSPERVAEIRHRIATGAYNAPEVLESIAQRMLESGDV